MDPPSHVRKEVRRRARAIALNRAAYSLSKHWFLLFLALTGLWVGLPWLAPLFMRLGWDSPARAIYALYAFQCHQLPQRSFFLFGESMMYPLTQIQAAWENTFDPLILRRFTGNALLGYKVAWSDRMVSAYSSIPLAGLLWWPMRRRLRPLPLWALALFALPMALDGGSHFISDLQGIETGFRSTNAWLVNLTGGRFPLTFYAGDALGSFNSWLRLITGGLFGAGLAWFMLPYANSEFEHSKLAIQTKFEESGERL